MLASRRESKFGKATARRAQLGPTPGDRGTGRGYVRDELHDRIGASATSGGRSGGSIGLDADLLELLSDEQWRSIREVPSVGRAAPVGRRPTDDRKVLEAVLWVMYHQARWQDLPEDYPSPRTCQRRLRLWQTHGDWDVIWDTYTDSLDDSTRDAWSKRLGEALLSIEPGADGYGTRQRIGRPPFWRATAVRFWQRTWDSQPADRRQALAHLIDREGASDGHDGS